MEGQRWTVEDADAPTAPDPLPRPYLVRALSCSRPAMTPSRWSLSGVVDVVISGKGPSSATRAGTLGIACNDLSASSPHATLRRSSGCWFVEDLGSKNGTTVNGERVSRRQLADGDLIETGNTAWWFRELTTGAPTPDVAAPDLTASFVTLHAPLEAAVTRGVAAFVAGLPVLVEGEPGVGKERLVAAVHARSRRPGALIAVSCAALPDALVEDALFGHRRGVLAGAAEERTGHILAADRGTLFLDEIGDLTPVAQAALLRVITERSVTPVGDRWPIPVDLAVVSATHRDIHAMVKAGMFSAELFARLRGVALWIPPLRDRREDIGMFIARTIAHVAPGATLQPDAARRLLMADWPANVRELERVVAAAVLRAGTRAIAPSDLESMAPRPPAAALPMAWSQAESALRARLVNALASHDGSISAVARELSCDRKQVHRWITRFAIDLRDPR